MKIFIFLLAVFSASRSAPTESDRLPEFLQALPFFSELQSLQQNFQDLQANIPAEVMSQLQQILPPFLVNILAGGQQTATTRTLEDLQSQLPQLIQTLTQLQASLPPEVLSQLQQSLPPFLASLLQQPAAGRGLQDVAQQLQQSLPPFLANLLASQLANGGSSQLLQQLQTVLPPEVFQQLQQIIGSLQPAAGRAGEAIDTEQLSEEQKKNLEDFVKRCQNYISGYGSSGYGYYPSSYNTGYGYNYPYNTGYPYGYSTGYNTGYPSISIQPSNQRYPSSTGVLYGTNGAFVGTGRSDLNRNDNDDIETNRKHGGGGKHGWKNPFNNYNNYYQKPNYGNYQKPSYGNYQKPNYGNFPYSDPYMYYNPYNGYQNGYQYPNYQNPNYNIGTIGDNGVVVPATGTGTNTTGTITAIREEAE